MHWGALQKNERFVETGFIADTGNDLLKYLEDHPKEKVTGLKTWITTSTEGCRWWICFIWGIIQWEHSSFVVHIVFQPVHLLGWKNVHDNNAYGMRVSYIMDRPFNIHLHHALYIYNYIYIYLSSHLHSMVWAQKWLMIAVNMSYQKNGGFRKSSKSSKSLDHDLVLKPMGF